LLTFTPMNALIPQLVTVAAVDDSVVEGAHASIIAHSASSSDSHYNGLPISDVVVNVIDNDVAAPAQIVISELMFNPATDESGAHSPEWIEVVNTSTSATDLVGWRFDDEDATNWGAIPGGTILNSNQIAVFFDSSFTTAAAFRADWSVPASALVVGISWGNLANNPSATNEILQLIDNLNQQIDIVNFDDANPWPSAADGPSIYLKNLAADNNVGSNWARSTTVAKAVSPTGGLFSSADVGSPGRIFTAGDYNLNGVTDATDYVLWRKTLGSNAILNADGSGPTVGTPNGIVDQADYTFWRANFGALGVLNGGLGSSSELAGGEENEAMAAASLLSAPSTTSSAPGPLLVTLSQESRAIGAAVTNDGGENPPLTAVVQSRHPSQWRATPTAVDRVDPLLSLGRSTALSPRTDEGFASHHTASEDRCAVIDQLFATFDDVRVLASHRRISSK
jgi:Lamin Tail Domain